MSRSCWFSPHTGLLGRSSPCARSTAGPPQGRGHGGSPCLSVPPHGTVQPNVAPLASSVLALPGRAARSETAGVCRAAERRSWALPMQHVLHGNVTDFRSLNATGLVQLQLHETQNLVLPACEQTEAGELS